MAINLTPIIDAVETALETEFAGTTLVFGVQAPTPANGSESVWVAVEFANYDYAATGIIYGLLTVNCFSHLGLSQATDLGDRAKDTLDGLTLAGVKADPATTPRQVTRAGSLYQVNTVVRFTVKGLTISAFSPTQGRIGDAITIYGTAFTGATSASINGVAIGSFSVVSDGIITGVVGNTTTTGKVSVTAPSGTGQSLTDFVIITGGVDWGDIGGTLSDQDDLNNILSRIRRYTTTTSVFTIPGIGGTSTVDVDDPQGFDSNVSIAIADGMGEYTQVTITSVSGNTLTVERDATGINTATGSTFPIGSFVIISLTAESIYGVVGLPSISNSVFDQDNDGIVDVATSIEGIDTAGNSKYYGTNASGTAGFYDLPPQNTYGSFFAASPAVKNIPLFTATRATTINELRGIKTASGTATISIQVGGVNVTGLTNLSITSSPQNFTATGGNTVSIGTRVTVDITAVSSATDLEFTLGATLN